MLAAIQSPFLHTSTAGSQFSFVGKTRLLIECRAWLRVAKIRNKKAFSMLSGYHLAEIIPSKKPSVNGCSILKKLVMLRACVGGYNNAMTSVVCHHI